jgi:TPR repeat protein
MKYFFLDENNNRKGPYSKDELLNLTIIHSDTLIWYEGCKGWKQLKEVFPNESSQIPPSFDDSNRLANRETSKSAKGWLSKGLFLLIAIAVVALGTLSFRYYLISSSERKLKTTGYHDETKLQIAEFLGSDYAGALLGIAYNMEEDTLKAASKFEKLRNSNDWRVVALRNYFFKEALSVDIVVKGINEKVDESDCLWIFYKSYFQLRGINGFEENKLASLDLMKRSADDGFVLAIRAYAELTDDISEKCKYYKRLVFSDYKRKVKLGKVCYNLAKLSLEDNGCMMNGVTFLNYVNKAIELGANEGYYLLGIAYQNGKGVEVDNAKAFENFKKAADYGVPEAIYSLSQCYKNGVGTSQSTDNYKTTLKSASDLGFAPAVDELAEVNKREAARYNQGSIQACECCGTTFDVSYGWGYDNSSGPFRKGSSSNIGRSFLAAALFGSDDSNIGLKYCRKQCAWDCN